MFFLNELRLSFPLKLFELLFTSTALFFVQRCERNQTILVSSEKRENQNKNINSHVGLQNTNITPYQMII